MAPKASGITTAELVQDITATACGIQVAAMDMDFSSESRKVDVGRMAEVALGR
jgi:hypothetical protein